MLAFKTMENTLGLPTRVTSLLSTLYASGGSYTALDLDDELDEWAVREATKKKLVRFSGSAWGHDETLFLTKKGYQSLGKECPPSSVDLALAWVSAGWRSVKGYAQRRARKNP